MLRGIHKASSTWVGKAVMAVIMGFLVVSFAIWGIGDIFRGVGSNTVADVGSAEISIEQFRQYYNERLQQLSRQAGRPISPDQARALGLDRQILGQMIAETTLDEQAHKLRLGLSDAEIAKRITGDPAFQGASGQFDRDRFEQLIRNAGYTEARFVDEQRRVSLRRQIAQTVSGDVKVPATILQAINQFQNERRDIEFLALGPAQAGDIPAPTPEQLSKYFDERKVLFRAPEYRKLTLLELSPAELAKPDEVSEADAKAYYAQHNDKYGTPEKRELRQIVFQKPEDATAARERIVKGASFDELAKERGLTASDTDLGLVTKAQVIDPAVAAAAFALPLNQISEPVKGRFGTVLVMATKVEPGQEKTYEEMAPAIKREIAESRARDKIAGLRDKVEDERAGGATLAETAKKFGLKAIVIDAVDRSGRGPDGKPIAALPRSPNVINPAFASDVGVDNEALQMPDGGYLYFDVNGVTPARDRPLDEVKDKVEARWRDDEIAKRLKAKAEDILGKLKAGTPLTQLAADNGVKVEKATDLQRGRPAPNAPAKLVEAAFKTAKGAAGTAEGTDETQQFVFQVTEVTIPSFDANSVQSKGLENQLKNAYADDIIGEYIGRLESDYGVKINQTAVNQVVGGSSQ
jgi:peptidyl-prolyl cis-trans isomerase D